MANDSDDMHRAVNEAYARHFRERAADRDREDDQVTQRDCDEALADAFIELSRATTQKRKATRAGAKVH